MSDADTLFIISSKRGSYVLEDMLAAISWSASGRSYFTVVVDETATLTKLEANGQYHLLHSNLPPETPGGFHRAVGLRWAVEQGIAYRHVIMLSDTCLLTALGVDAFFLPTTQKEHVGLIGVRADSNHIRSWREASPLLFQWKLPLNGWERPPISLCDDFLVLSGRFVVHLYANELLVPEKCSEWPTTYGAYLSWACHLTGFFVVSWGYETKPLPPLYISRAAGANLPSPHLFATQFMAFAPINTVMGYCEEDVRELYKAQRGERSRDVAKLQPVVTGPEQNDTHAH